MKPKAIRRDRYPVITICGSTRFKDDFRKAERELSVLGWVVLTVNIFGHSGDEEINYEGMKTQLDAIHKQKISMSDAIFVINKDGYIGESTQSEIKWAKKLGKEIYYLEDKGR